MNVQQKKSALFLNLEKAVEAALQQAVAEAVASACDSLTKLEALFPKKAVIAAKPQPKKKKKKRKKGKKAKVSGPAGWSPGVNSLVD